MKKKLFPLILFLMISCLIASLAEASTEDVQDYIGELPYRSYYDPFWKNRVGNDVTYEWDQENGILTLSGTGPMYNNGRTMRYTDATFCYNYFRDIKHVNKLIVGEGITSIGIDAFSYISSIDEVIIASSVTHIGSCAFYRPGGIRIKKLTLNEGLKYIGERAFNFATMTSVVIPGTVEKIAVNALSSYQLETVYFNGSPEAWSKVDKDSFSLYSDPKIYFLYPHEHDYPNPFSWKATCTEDGYTSSRCSICGEEKRDIIPATGHDFSQNTKYCANGCGTENPNYDPARNDISSWTVKGVKNLTYNGRALEQSNLSVERDGIKATVSVEYRNNVNVGTATMIISGKGDYSGTIEKTFKINPAKNAITFTSSTKRTVDASLFKSGSMTIQLFASARENPKITYKLSSGGNNFIKLGSNGKLMLKKGLKKGTYMLKIKMTAKATDNYKKTSAKETIEIIVK